jgi:hypothetical protein
MDFRINVGERTPATGALLAAQRQIQARNAALRRRLE